MGVNRLLLLALLGASAGAAPSVIFRFDDVQDWGVADGVNLVVDLFLEQQAPLSMGVIGGSFYGSQWSPVPAKVQEGYAAGFEVFNHGDDAVTEFNNIDKEEAMLHIKNAEVEGFEYTSFVPHQNRWAPSTIEALSELGYKVISTCALCAEYAQMPYDLESTPMMLPQATQTAAYVWTNPWDEKWVNTADEILPKCEEEVGKHGVCVVMMHPQEFQQVKNPVTAGQLRAVIEGVRARGWEITTFRDFYAAVQDGTRAPPVPSMGTPEPASTPEPVTPKPETPEPVTPKPPTQAPPTPSSDCPRVLGEWEGCLDNQGCCAEGLECRVSSQWWASCRRA